MNGLRGFGRVAPAGVAAALALMVFAGLPRPAEARVVVSVGVPFPGVYAPYPYPFYPPPYYPPPPPPAYYPAPVAAPAPAPAAAAAPTAITYTDRAPFRNTAGQTCREYRSSTGAIGTACQDASGQWRTAN